MVISIPCLTAALMPATACDGFRAAYVSAGGAPGAPAHGVDTAYAERDACLARNATERPQASMRALALACAAQTDHRYRPRRRRYRQRHPRRQ
jgi:hypothetical protein